MMETSGIPATRYFDAVLLPKDQVAQKDNVKALMVMEATAPIPSRACLWPRVGLEALDMLVVCDPHPTTWAVLGERKNGTYLPADLHPIRVPGLAYGIERLAPSLRADRQALFESKHDGAIIYMLAKKLGFADQMVQKH